MIANKQVALERVREAGESSGFRPLLRRELGAWWKTSKWFKQLLIWLAIMNGMLLLVSATGRLDSAPHPPALILQEGLDVFFNLGMMAASLGAVIVTQGAIIGERQSGTAAWVLSKPASRRCFILSKFVAYAFSLLLLVVGLQGIIAFVQIGLWSGMAVNLPGFAAGVGLIALSALFYLALSLMLGTFYRGRGAVTGTAIGFIFLGQILSGVLPVTQYILPSRFSDAAVALAAGQDLPANFWIAPIATLVWTVLMLAIALLRFEREEL